MLTYLRTAASPMQLREQKQKLDKGFQRAGMLEYFYLKIKNN